MGRNIYLSDKEIKALRDTASEWSDIMNNGEEESRNAVTERLNDGLGSAMKKLHKGTNGERIYRNY